MPDSLGQQADQYFMMRERKRQLQEELIALEKEMTIKEAELMASMDVQGVTQISGHAATISITESIKPSTEDWDEFKDYVLKTGYFHLVDRKPSVLGCREIFEKGGRIPGLVPYVQRKLRMLKR